LFCRYCGAPVPKDSVFCPVCGRTLKAAPVPRGRRRSRLAALSVGVLLAAVLALALRGSPADRSPSDREMARTVVTSGDFSLTNTELGYYFWNEYFYFLKSGGSSSASAPDASRPLDSQYYDAKTTWQDYLLDQALTTVRCTMSMVFQARAAGFALPADYRKSLDTVLSQFASRASSAGYADTEAYLRASYGEGATLASFTDYLTDSYLASAYADALYDKPSFTAQQISEYYDDYAESYASEGIRKDDELLRSLRVVLLAPDDDRSAASWNAAKQTAESLYRSWISGGGSDAALAELAKAQSDDADTASNGGEKKDVSRADLSGELLDWAFDPARRAGDSGVMKTDDGWTIVRFEGLSAQTRWQQAAEADLRHDTYADAYTRITENDRFLVNYGAIRIREPDNLAAAAGTENTP